MVCSVGNTYWFLLLFDPNFYLVQFGQSSVSHICGLVFVAYVCDPPLDFLCFTGLFQTSAALNPLRTVIVIFVIDESIWKTVNETLMHNVWPRDCPSS